MQHGTTQLRGRHHSTFDNTIDLLIAVVDLARKDATGRVTAASKWEWARWQQDAIAFLEDWEI